MAVAVAVLFLQSGRAGKHTAATRATADRRNHRECGQVQRAFDFFSRVDRVVEIFEEEGQTDAEANRKEERSDDRARAIWTNRRVGRERVIDDRDIVRLACHDDVVLFRALEQSVQQRFIRFDLLLDDAVVNRGFILRKSLRALLLESLAQRLLALERLLITRVQIRQQRCRLATTHIFQLPIQFSDLLVDLFHFRRFFSGVNHQQGAFLAELVKFRFNVVGRLAAVFC